MHVHALCLKYYIEPHVAQVLEPVGAKRLRSFAEFIHPGWHPVRVRFALPPVRGCRLKPRPPADFWDSFRVRFAHTGLGSGFGDVLPKAALSWVAVPWAGLLRPFRPEEGRVAVVSVRQLGSFRSPFGEAHHVER